jgi:hypothetical protein
MRFVWFVLALQAAAATGPPKAPPWVRSWTVRDSGIDLQLQEGYPLDPTRDWLRGQIPTATISVDGGALRLASADPGALQARIAGLEAPSDLQDVDAMIAGLSSTATTRDGSGSSIRAKRDLHLTPTDKVTFVGSVLAVKRGGSFPLVALVVSVDSVPHNDRPNALEAKQLLVIPRIRFSKGRPSLKDPVTYRHRRLWYARKGDQVGVTLEPRPRAIPFQMAAGQPIHDTVWIAERVQLIDQ